MSDENVGGLVELLPCPFCGSGAEFVAYKRDGLTIRCKALGCVSRNQRAIRLSIDQLREAMANNWNTRVSAHGQPVVDERINRAWKLVERWEQPTIDGDTLTKEERLRNMGFAAMLRAALGDTP